MPPPTTPAPAPPPGVGTSTSTVFRFFGPLSVWNAPLVPAASIAPDSTAISGTLIADVDDSLASGTGPWINTTSYSTPIYTVPSNQPTVPVIMDYNNQSLQAAMSAVPMPAGAQAAAGSDGEMTVYQPSSDTLWEMFKMRQGLLPPPFLSGIVSPGGSLPTGRYFYAVTALTATGETTVSPVVSYAVPAGGTVTLHWYGPLGSNGYRIYRGTSAMSLQLVGSISHPTTQPSDPGCTWTDDGSSSPAAVSPPATNTATTPGHWHAKWGGRILNEASDPGYYRDIANPSGGYFEQASWGVTASSLPVAGGLITLADLAAGHINHALAIMVPKAAQRVFDFPAQRTDGVDGSPNAVPEGARFRLPPDLDLSQLPMPPVTREIAEAAQQYGLIVNDQTGASVGFRAEDPTPLTRRGQPNPYLMYFTNASGAYVPPNQLLASFPWRYLEMVAPPQ